MKKIYIYIFIAAVVVVLAGIYVDKNSNINVTQSPPVNQKSSATTVALGDFGKAPDFKTGDPSTGSGQANWLNSAPLTIGDLKGKVVLVDFWTFSCINCIRTLPHVTKWYDTYKDKGLVVVGVHSPEFTFEKDAGKVKNAMAQFGIHYPVVQDNDFGIWKSYKNQYWPAEYLVNQQGNIVHEKFGEGEYDVTENAIRYLLGMDAVANPNSQTSMTNDNLTAVGSPEMYFGTDREQNLTLSQSSSLTPKTYTLNKNMQLNEFSLGGQWQFSGPSIKLTGATGQMNLKFHSGKVFMVASSQNPATLSIIVDGKAQPSVIVQESKLYTLFDSQDYSDHTIEITIIGTGFEGFTFTFG